MIPLIKSMAPAYGGPDKIEPLWWCLSLGACLGGNGTLIGASANLTVAGHRGAQRRAVPLHDLHALRLPDDAGVDRDLPRLRLVAVFLSAAWEAASASTYLSALGLIPLDS